MTTATVHGSQVREATVPEVSTSTPEITPVRPRPSLTWAAVST